MTEARLAGRTAIVTGASRGIGLAAAVALHDAGANVVLTSRTEEAAVAASSSVGDRAVGIGAHATDEAAARVCVERTLERFGRIGEPEDIGTAITFLASDLSSWITGETLVIDGGQMIGSGAAADGLAAGVGIG